MSHHTLTPSFWYRKRVLITGHTGFKGSWLSLWLQQLGAEVVGYALAPPGEPNLFTVGRVSKGMVSIYGDVNDLVHLNLVLKDFGPEVVIHLAAQSVVRASYEDPVTTFTTNVLGSVKLMEAVRQAKGVKAVVMVTSDKCYENREWVWGYREVDALGGYDPYSSSKACAELAAASYRHAYFSRAAYAQHGVALATARAGNVIGGGDWKRDALVPDTVRALLEGEQTELRNPHATRPWQFVLEPLRGYLMLAERLYHGAEYAEAWNFGPHDADVRTVSWIAEKLHKLWGSPYFPQESAAAQPHEDTLLKLDATKAATRLGWQTLLPLETTLSWIVAWTKAFAAGEDMRRVCEEQLEVYMRLTDEAQAGTPVPHRLHEAVTP